MKEELKQAKKKMKEYSLPYQIYGYYVSIPTLLLIILACAFLGIDLPSSFGGIVFIFTILANMGVRKLPLISNRKYVAPILVYIANGISFFVGFGMIMMLSSGLSMDPFLILNGLMMLPLEILAIIFFFITANDIKKAYPTMKEDAKESRQLYKNLKKGV